MITGNFKSLIELMQTFSDEQKCIDYLESVIWNANIKLQYRFIAIWMYNHSGGLSSKELQ